MTFNKRAFGRELKRLRIKAGYKSSRIFAETIGVPVDTIRSWESGRWMPKAHRLDVIGRALAGDKWLVAVGKLFAAAYREADHA